MISAATAASRCHRHRHHHCQPHHYLEVEVYARQLMADFDIRDLAIPSVCLLISFLAYSSQLLFLYLDPGPLTWIEVLKFNSLVLCIWVCYARACKTNPGDVPQGWTPQSSSDGKQQEVPSEACVARSRWCRKCEVMKPPRAHHCKVCARFDFCPRSL